MMNRAMEYPFFPMVDSFNSKEVIVSDLEQVLPFFPSQIVIDTTKNKQNKYTPGSHLRIYSPEKQPFPKIDYYFLGAWNFKKEIICFRKFYSVMLG